MMLFACGLVTEKNAVYINYTEKIWRIASGAANNKWMLKQKCCFHAGMTIILTDGALKLDYVSVIFVDPQVQIDKTELNSLTTTTVVACHTHGLLVHTTQQDSGSAHTKHAC